MKTRYNPAEPTKISAFNRRANALAIAFFTVVIVLAFLPVLLVIMSALSSEESVSLYGYRFIPREFSLEAFRVMLRSGSTLPRAFLNSVLITLGGTALGLAIMCPCAYALSRGEFRHRKGLMLFLMIPMLFSGGLVATYMINTQVYHLKNTYLALILPGACSTFYVIVMRTFFQTTIPDSIIESGKIDGARQIRIFTQLVLPISLPVIATIGLFLTFNYWNAWYGAMLYLDSNHRELYPLQYVLISIEKNIAFMAKNEEHFMGDSMRNVPSETARMAIVMVVVIPIACSYPFFQRYFVGGLTIGAVKG